MMKKTSKPEHIPSISEFHRILELEEPKNKLISLVSLNQMSNSIYGRSFAQDFYTISYMEKMHGKLRYGQNNYELASDGTMGCIGPGQVISLEKDPDRNFEGYLLAVHPDFFRDHPLYRKMKDYHFFSYSFHEALILNDEEKELVLDIYRNIEKELSNDTNELIVAYVNLLLNYCNRFYKRMFHEQKDVNSDILKKLEAILDSYFESEDLQNDGFPSVKYVSDALNFTPNYLSDVLREFTGKSTSQHIQYKAVDKAKELLGITNLSISEIAYVLGFEYPQSFNKFFKRITTISPQKYRLSLRGHS